MGINIYLHHLRYKFEPMAGFEPALRGSILITNQMESTTVPHRQKMNSVTNEESN